MTILAEKLKLAGADTVGARLTAMCTDAIRDRPDADPAAIWRKVGELFGHEFVQDLIKDMRGSEIKKLVSDLSADLRAYGHPMVLPDVLPKPPKVPSNNAQSKPFTPRVIPQERIERRRELQQIVRSKFKNSLGVVWSDVGWHELAALSRDGNEASALLRAGPATVPNDGRNVGQVLGVAAVDSIIENTRYAQK